MRIDFYLAVSVTPGVNPETLVQIEAAANHRIEVLGMDIGLGGSTPATTPIPLDWIIQTNGGTNPTALTAQKQDRGYDETITGTFQGYDGGTAVEPTDDGAILCALSLHQQGFLPWRPPFPLVAKGAERIGLRYKSATAVAVNLTLYCRQ